MNRLDLKYQHNPGCLLQDYVPPYDSRCCEYSPSEYNVLHETSPDLGLRLAHINGPDLKTIQALEQTDPTLPSFLPTVKPGQKNLYGKLKPGPVGIMLGSIVSAKKLTVATSLGAINSILPNSPKILLSYGRDQLLENIWPKRISTLGKISQLGFVAATGLNYSVWGNQPHLEGIYNIKRGLMTFKDWQCFGLPSIPHVYWCSRICLERWAEWLRLNPNIRTIAINLQTLRSNKQWGKAVDDLRYFAKLISHQIRVLITGPSVAERIRQCLEIFPNCTISNGCALQYATSSRVVDDRLKPHYSDLDKDVIAALNVSAYEKFINRRRSRL